MVMRLLWTNKAAQICLWDCKRSVTVLDDEQSHAVSEVKLTKMDFVVFSGFELPCTEEAPTCMETCGRMRQCGRHPCTERCHVGPCSTVGGFVVQPCTQQWNWWSGVAIVRWSRSTVNLRWAWLVLGLVTLSGFSFRCGTFLSVCD